jgi:surface protein
MQSIFYGAPSYNNGANSDINTITGRPGINGWDTSAVTNMITVFYDAAAFNRSLSDWNTSSATSMSGMFGVAPSFDQDISKWDLRNVTTTASMFRGAAAFNNGDNVLVNPITGRPGIDGWSLGNCTDMSRMFMGTQNASYVFNRSISNWDVGKVTTFYGMFASGDNIGSTVRTPFNQDISKWNIGQYAATASVSLKYMFWYSQFNNGANSDTNPLTGRTGSNGWDLSKVNNYYNYYYYSASYYEDLESPEDEPPSGKSPLRSTPALT